jgi:hypothetical protein
MDQAQAVQWKEMDSLRVWKRLLLTEGVDLWANRIVTFCSIFIHLVFFPLDIPVPEMAKRLHNVVFGPILFSCHPSLPKYYLLS